MSGDNKTYENIREELAKVIKNANASLLGNLSDEKVDFLKILCEQVRKACGISTNGNSMDGSPGEMKIDEKITPETMQGLINGLLKDQKFTNIVKENMLLQIRQQMQKAKVHEKDKMIEALNGAIDTLSKQKAIDTLSKINKNSPYKAIDILLPVQSTTTASLTNDQLIDCYKSAVEQYKKGDYKDKDKDKDWVVSLGQKQDGQWTILEYSHSFAQGIRDIFGVRNQNDLNRKPSTAVDAPPPPALQLKNLSRRLMLPNPCPPEVSLGKLLLHQVKTQNQIAMGREKSGL